MSFFLIKIQPEIPKYILLTLKHGSCQDMLSALKVLLHSDYMIKVKSLPDLKSVKEEKFYSVNQF